MIGVVLGLALSGALAEPPPRKNSVEQAPDILEAPSAADLAAVYPERAVRTGVGGAVRMACAVTVEGALVGCRINDETPTGYGFGEAVLKLAPKFRMTPKRRNGVAVAADEVVFPIRFQVPKITSGIGEPATLSRPLPWASRPTAGDLRAVYPIANLASGVSGDVTLACVIAKGGALRDCRAVEERPDQVGFGEAALKLAPKFIAATQTDKGDRTEDAVVFFHLQFEPDAQGAEAPSGDAVSGKPPQGSAPANAPGG